MPSSGNDEVTSTAEPWSKQAPYLENLFANAQGLYENTAGWPQMYPGTQIAPFNPSEMAALQGQADTAYGPANHLAAQAANAQTFMLGPHLNPESNPHLVGAVRGAMRPVQEKLMRDILPGIRSGASQAGQYGGSRQGIAEGLAISDATRQMVDRSAGMYSDAYQQGLDVMARAQTLTPQVMDTMFKPSQMLGNVGSAYRLMDQAFLDNYVNEWYRQQAQPWDMLAQYQNAIAGNYGGTTTQEQPGGGSNALNVLGTLASVLSIPTTGNILGAFLT